ncbi:hypothetical protein RCIP0085_00062 [Klebsiella phage RCIP0085]
MASTSALVIIGTLPTESNNNFMLLGELPRGPLGAKLYESVYVGDAPKRKLTNVEIFSLAKLVLSLALLVSVIAVIAIDFIGAQP